MVGFVVWTRQYSDICSVRRYGEKGNFCRADNSMPKTETGRFPVANAIMTRCAEQCRLNNSLWES